MVSVDPKQVLLELDSWLLLLKLELEHQVKFIIGMTCASTEHDSLFIKLPFSDCTSVEEVFFC